MPLPYPEQNNLDPTTEAPDFLGSSLTSSGPIMGEIVSTDEMIFALHYDQVKCHVTMTGV